MKFSTKLLTASTIAAVAVAAAGAAGASVFVSFDGSTTVATQANGSYDFLFACATPTACGGFAGVEVSGATGSLPTLLHSTTADVTTAAGTAADLTIYVTRNDITGADYSKYFSSFTGNNTGNGSFETPFTVVMTTYIDPANHLYTGNQISTFTTSDFGAFASNQIKTEPLPGAEYSVTEKYVISATAFGQAESTSPTIALQGVGGVPEPASWGLMLLGFGGMGALLRNRRRAAAVAA